MTYLLYRTSSKCSPPVTLSGNSLNIISIRGGENRAQLILLPSKPTELHFPTDDIYTMAVSVGGAILYLFSILSQCQVPEEMFKTNTKLLKATAPTGAECSRVRLKEKKKKIKVMLYPQTKSFSILMHRHTNTGTHCKRSHACLDR